MAKKIRLPVRDFATPIRPKGHYMGTPTEGVLNLGAEIHRKVQERHHQSPGFRSEVLLTHTLECEGYEFHLSGRADGVFQGDPPLIEEIKSTHRLKGLLDEIDSDDEHPYRLQTLTYCLLYKSFYGCIPQGQIRLISTRTEEEDVIGIEYDEKLFSGWVKEKLLSLVQGEKEKAKIIKRRKALCKQVTFPFSKIRPNQDDLMKEVESTLQSKSTLLVQAPTGIGKTLGVLYPSLQDTLSRGAQLIYVTPKNSQFQLVKETIAAMKAAGKAPRILILSAKSKICLNEEVHCHPKACEYSRDFYDKVWEEKLGQKLRKASTLDFQRFQKLGRNHNVCPYALSHQALDSADLIVCDYNYVFSPNASLSRLYTGMKKPLRPTLLIDEAHNLYERARDYYSPQLGLGELEYWSKTTDTYPSKLKKQSNRLWQKVRDWITENEPAKETCARIELDGDQLQKLKGQAIELLGELMSHAELNTEPLADLLNRITMFEEIILQGGDEYLQLYLKQWDFEGIKIKCLDASRHLSAVYENFHSVIAFSATVKPFEFFRRLSGFPAQTRFHEFPSSFPPENRKVVLIPQISTAFRDRERNYGKIAEVVSRISHCEPGHYVVFLPSYKFLERIAELLEGKIENLILQTPNLARRRIEEIKERISENHSFSVVLAVQGGALAEGIDFQGKHLKGVFIVGPGMPSFDFEREQLRSYYDKHYKKGFAYAYTYPAMIRSIQAAGRLIRSETKRGLLVFMDRRFIQGEFAELFPSDWYQENVRELVSSKILSEVQEFWEKGPEAEQ